MSKEQKTVFVPIDLLKEIMEVAGKDKNKPLLCGIVIDYENEKLFATDGKRFIRKELPDQERTLPYEEVIPSSFDFEIGVSVNKKFGLLHMLEKRFKNEVVSLSFEKNVEDNVLKLVVKADETKAKVEVDLSDGSIAFDEFSININTSFLISCLTRILKNRHARASMKFCSGNDPITVNAYQDLGVEVIMPAVE